MYLRRDGVYLPLEEIKDHARQIEASEGPVSRAIFLAAITDKIEAAGLGQLEYPDDVKTDMVNARGINELRWRLDGNKHWRLYYCEPLRLSPDRVMLALRFNGKASIEQQDRDLSESASRYTWWQASQAG